MERFTISLDKQLARAFDELIRERGYTTRSEAVRDILRTQLQASHQRRDHKGSCVASVSYVYNHHQRELAERLTSLQHARHELVISSMHAHLDHEHCIETVLLKGPAERVREFANQLIAERGVRHGAVNLVSAGTTAPHRHDGVTHRHLSPKY
ncbi:MAG TPA: nickel-responsive transcriptional regulator NikR [Steroidobacteraceae bacterium]|nr:nickel-responsive transcriptional regulator NikR [Steroidobacteraceae bacterium]